MRLCIILGRLSVFTMILGRECGGGVVDKYLPTYLGTYLYLGMYGCMDDAPRH